MPHKAPDVGHTFNLFKGIVNDSRLTAVKYESQTHFLNCESVNGLLAPPCRQSLNPRVLFTRTKYFVRDVRNAALTANNLRGSVFLHLENYAIWATAEFKLLQASHILLSAYEFSM